MFWGWIPPGLNLSENYARGRGGLQPGASRDCGPPWGGRPKAGRAAGSFARRSGKADRPARTSPRRSAKADRTARTSSRRSGKADRPARSLPRRSGKADNGGRLCPGGAFSAARPAGTARFLITRGKASFYETATFGRRKVFFCSPFCGLLFCPARAKLALPAGEKPAAPKPRPPRGGPAQRPRPAPGFCAASANARPGDPAPVRLLEKALWVPPTTEPFRPAPSGKPEKERKMKGGSPNAAPTPGTPTPGLARPLRLKMAGRAPSRNAPSVAESPQNNQGGL